MSMPNNQYSPTAWGVQFLDLTCPSGQLCQVRWAGVQHLIAAGVIENVDTITAMVDQKHLKRVAGKARTDAEKAGQLMPDGSVIDTGSMMKDPAQVGRVFELIDKVVMHMVVQPAIIPVPDDPTGRLAPDAILSQSRVYIDMIDLADKMFIFQYAVGGGTDLDQFRKQFNQGMGGVAPS